MPTVSVVIPTYNRAQRLTQAIESVLAQTYQDWELIVIDDGSTDETSKAVANYAAHDGRIRYVRQANRCAAAARNRGILMGKAQFIAFLDDDDQWAPEKLALQVDFMQEHHGLGWVYSFMTMMDQGQGSTSLHGRVVRTFGELFRGYFIGPQSAMIRRECFKRAGLFREDIRFVEDTEMFLRLAKHYPFGCIEQPLVIRNLHEDNGSIERHAQYLEATISMYRGFDLKGQTEVRWLDKIRRLASLHCYTAQFYRENGAYLQAASHILRAVMVYPPIGIYSAIETPRGLHLIRAGFSPLGSLFGCVMHALRCNR